MSPPVIGILGGGQLAEMLALAGYPLGLRFRVLDPSADAPAGDLAPLIIAPFDDADALAELADGVDCLTYESEAIPPAALETLLAMGVTVRPGVESLRMSGDRLLEKNWLAERGIPTAPYRSASSAEELRTAIQDLGAPVIVKTRRGGYDGRGQVWLDDASSVEDVWEELGQESVVVERVLEFDRELSQVSAQYLSGEMRHYPLVENLHEDGILTETIAPAWVPMAFTTQANAWAREIARGLGHIGVLTIELFETADGLVVNEIAPRVHNSGHWTIEGATTSQFESHLRAILGLPLRPTRALSHARMVNFIGEPPDPARISDPGAAIHAYRKEPRPGRKVGHVTLVDSDPLRLDQRAEALEGRTFDVAGRSADIATPLSDSTDLLVSRAS